MSANESPTVQIVTTDYNGLLPVDRTERRGDDSRPAPAVLEHFGIRKGVSVFLTSELPPHTGMATYSAGVVALIRAAMEFREQQLSSAQIAELACDIEINQLGRPVGKQDAYATALGGLNCIQFDAEGVQSQPIRLEPSVVDQFGRRLMLFFTGRYQKTSEALNEYKRAGERNRASVVSALHQMKEAAIGLRRDLELGNLDVIGQWLDQSWSASRLLARGFSDPWVDQWYQMARGAGALGGGTAGLGASGFIFLYCPIERQKGVEDALDTAGLRRVDFRLAFEGVALILNEQIAPRDGTREASLLGAQTKRAQH
jgi:D-glycero-alpha-D-manno-heptose-7-phosphate kinase